MQRMCSRRAVPLNWIGRYAAVLTRPCGLIPRFTGSPNRGSSVLGFCTARSVLRNEQGKRPLKIRTLGSAPRVATTARVYGIAASSLAQGLLPVAEQR
jgi:hypothetical protein